ncbi:hypothetical protein XF36_03225 [Pseudonocardia sp. HH130629-09]|nr:hypothetical protein XF36_03225 [Pseudonocardia sp. HH130629-09]
MLRTASTWSRGADQVGEPFRLHGPTAGRVELMCPVGGGLRRLDRQRRPPRDPVRPFQGGVDHRVGRHDGAHQAGPQGRSRVAPVTGEQHVLGRAEPEQPPGAHDQADVDPGSHEEAVLGGDPQVAGQGEFKPGADGASGDRGDHGDAELLDPVGELDDLGQEGRGVAVVAGVLLLDEMATGAEVTDAGEDGGAEPGVTVHLVEGVAQCRTHGTGQRVGGRGVQREDGDVLPVAAQPDAGGAGRPAGARHRGRGHGYLRMWAAGPPVIDGRAARGRTGGRPVGEAGTVSVRPGPHGGPSPRRPRAAG